jgi:2-methylcitrate dehydratase
MDMNEEELTHAVGISGSHGCTLGKVVAGKLSNMKNTAEPFAVADGVIAALLAKEGYSGPEEVFEGKEGLFHCLGEAWNPSILTEGLGSDPLRINQCSMKAFPTEALTHTPIGAFLSIVRENNISYDQIDSVLVKSIERAADILSDPAKYRPESKETADHSLPYCMAVGAVDHAVTPDSFNEERLEDERIFSVIDKFKVVAEPEFEEIFPEKQACHVTVKTTGGESYELRMDYPKGDPREPMTEEELDIKFRALAGKVMSDKQMDEVKEATFNLDQYDSFEDFMQVLISK